MDNKNKASIAAIAIISIVFLLIASPLTIIEYVIGFIVRMVLGLLLVWATLVAYYFLRDYLTGVFRWLDKRKENKNKFDKF